MVTGLPWHTGLTDAAMDTPTLETGFTLMLTALERDGFPEGQVMFEVSLQEILSLLDGA
jgi:hypothetical protein